MMAAKVPFGIDAAMARASATNLTSSSPASAKVATSIDESHRVTTASLGFAVGTEGRKERLG